jgi:hypothetical protein
MSVLVNISRCTEEAIIFASKLAELEIDDFCFSIVLPNDYSLSISIPCDLALNKMSQSQDYPKVIETLLFHKEKREFNTNFGYENDNDVKRFYGELRASEDDNVDLVKTHITNLISLIKEELRNEN